MHIAPTRLLEVDSSNAKYDLEERLRKGFIGADWGYDSKIEYALAANNDKDDNEEDS